MNRYKLPLSVMILSGVYIAVGTVGFVAHFRDLWSSGAFQYDGLSVELVEIVAIICGVFMLLGRNWARWLALAWIAFHVILSAVHTLGEFAIHGLFCVVIAWILFRPESAQYFRATGIHGT